MRPLRRAVRRDGLRRGLAHVHDLYRRRGGRLRRRRAPTAAPRPSARPAPGPGRPARRGLPGRRLLGRLGDRLLQRARVGGVGIRARRLRRAVERGGGLDRRRRVGGVRRLERLHDLVPGRGREGCAREERGREEDRRADAADAPAAAVRPRRPARRRAREPAATRSRAAARAARRTAPPEPVRAGRGAGTASSGVTGGRGSGRCESVGSGGGGGGVGSFGRCGAVGCGRVASVSTDVANPRRKRRKSTRLVRGFRLGISFVAPASSAECRLLRRGSGTWASSAAATDRGSYRACRRRPRSPIQGNVDRKSPLRGITAISPAGDLQRRQSP